MVESTHLLSAGTAPERGEPRYPLRVEPAAGERNRVGAGGPGNATAVAGVGCPRRGASWSRGWFSIPALVLAGWMLGEGARAASGPRRIRDLGPAAFNVSVSLARLVSYQGQVCFFAQTEASGLGFWRTDGGDTAPVLVRDLGASRLALPGPVEFADRLYFVLSTRREGTVGPTDYLDLWASDGTPEGTIRVRELSRHVVVFSFGAEAPVVSEGLLYFTGQKPGLPGGNTLLWRSDGSSEGTFPVLDTFQTFPVIRDLTALPGGVVFSAPSKTSNAGYVLWRSDGTREGTVEVLDPDPRNAGNPFLPGMVRVNDRVFFRASEGAMPWPAELWRTDGTTAGTTNWPGLFFDPGELQVLDGHLLLFMDQGWLFGMDETPDSLVRLHEDPVATSMRPGTVVDGRLWFGGAMLQRAQVWATDATEAGTFPVATLSTNHPPGGSPPAGFFPLGRAVYFHYDDGVSGREIWVTDRDTFRTARVAEIRPGADSSIGQWQGFAAVDHRLFYVATEDGFTHSLWVLEAEAGPPPAIRLLPPERTSQGYRLRMHGPAGVQLRLQRAPRVTGPWADLTPLTLDAAGLAEFEDRAVPAEGGYYRTVHP